MDSLIQDPMASIGNLTAHKISERTLRLSIMDSVVKSPLVFQEKMLIEIPMISDQDLSVPIPMLRHGKMPIQQTCKPLTLFPRSLTILMLLAALCREDPLDLGLAILLLFKTCKSS
jgi:hypothetical protein